ncbi:MAG: putative 2-phosphosulfolactate phosphatase [Planctomycetota bacterium]|jgi:2-phosphosulfolactate phosphatase
MRWHCHELFNRMPPGAVAGGIAVVIDVLRASTTIVTALANAASRIRPVPAVAEALALAEASGAGRPLLGGERGGVRIAGFDLGNSPLEYSPAAVAGREIVVTTTNGTAALEACRAADEVLVGAIVNRTAVARLARDLARRRGGADIHLVCAGTDGHVTEEDVLAAGSILEAACRLPDGAADLLDPAAAAARADFRRVVGQAASPREAIVSAFAVSRGGTNLLSLGMDADLPAAAAIDTIRIVPRLDPATGWLVPELPDAGLSAERPH